MQFICCMQFIHVNKNVMNFCIGFEMDNGVFIPFPHHILPQIFPGGMLELVQCTGRRVAATLHCGGYHLLALTIMSL